MLQCCCAVLAASLFRDFCFAVPNVASQIRSHEKPKKKAFSLYLTTQFASAAVLQRAFCIPYRKGSCLFQSGMQNGFG